MSRRRRGTDRFSEFFWERSVGKERFAQLRDWMNKNLAEAKADVDKARDLDGVTPLLQAARTGHTDIVAILVRDNFYADRCPKY